MIKNNKTIIKKEIQDETKICNDFQNLVLKVNLKKLNLPSLNILYHTLENKFDSLT